MINDPIADMLTRIRNGLNKNHSFVLLPATAKTLQISKILLQEGYLSNIDQQFDGEKNNLILHIKYKYEERKKVSIINSIKRVSRPGLRVYVTSKKIPRVLDGIGIAILSTSKGILSDRKAREFNLGGELLCEIW